MQTRTRSGSSETEVKELAVMPWTTPGSRSTVITVTPVTKVPATRRNVRGSREEMAMALSIQDNTEVHDGSKEAASSRLKKHHKTMSAPRGERSLPIGRD